MRPRLNRVPLLGVFVPSDKFPSLHFFLFFYNFYLISVVKNSIFQRKKLLGNHLNVKNNPRKLFYYEKLKNPSTAPKTALY